MYIRILSIRQRKREIDTGRRGDREREKETVSKRQKEKKNREFEK
jgi:hypothetical protein